MEQVKESHACLEKSEQEDTVVGVEKGKYGEDHNGSRRRSMLRAPF